MTGLSLTDDALIEVAALVTDDELNVLGNGVDVVIKPTDAALEQMNDFVRDMHVKSGLLPELPQGMGMEEAEAEFSSTSRNGSPSRARLPWAVIPWAPTRPSSRATCPIWWITCTTA